MLFRSLEHFDRIRRRMDGKAFRELLARETDCEMLAGTLVTGETGFTGLYQETGPAPQFVCPCNREKMAAVVRTLPIPERMEIVKKGEPLAIRCQFCNHRYELTVDDCIAAWNRKP